MRQGDTHVFRWHDGTFPEWTNWRMGRPSGENSFHCVSVNGMHITKSYKTKLLSRDSMRIMIKRSGLESFIENIIIVSFFHN